MKILPLNKGGQPKNKNAEKWTEARALELGNELIAWLREKPENILLQEFLLVERGIYRTVIQYLSRKYDSFSSLIKEAKALQEHKLVSGGVFKQLNPGMTIFVLIKHHGWQHKTTTTTKEEPSLPYLDLSKLTDEELEYWEYLAKKASSKTPQ